MLPLSANVCKLCMRRSENHSLEFASEANHFRSRLHKPTLMQPIRNSNTLCAGCIKC